MCGWQGLCGTRDWWRVIHQTKILKVVVVQKGAREHFLAARALHRQGMLAQLVVDWYAPSNPLLRSFLKLGRGAKFQGAMAAASAEIPCHLLRAKRLNGLLSKWRQGLSPSAGSRHERALKADTAFTRTMARLPLPTHDVFFGYSYMSLELLRAEKDQGVLTVLDQIDPGPVHFRLASKEMERHPELGGPPEAYPTAYFERLREEWSLADVIVVNSGWTKDALVLEGVDPAKIELLPLAYESKFDERQTRPADRVEDQAPLRVLWLGQITPGKGINYLMEAARILLEERVQFNVVGPSRLLPGALVSAPRNMSFFPAVSRNCVGDWYRRNDIFVLPTLSDGFAITQLEAFAHGLPVIATPNCGRVVVDGETGFIVPLRDPQALADAILRFARTPGLASSMGAKCREAVKMYSIEAYGQRLAEIILKHRNRLNK